MYHQYPKAVSDRASRRATKSPTPSNVRLDIFELRAAEVLNVNEDDPFHELRSALNSLLGQNNASGSSLGSQSSSLETDFRRMEAIFFDNNLLIQFDKENPPDDKNIIEAYETFTNFQALSNIKKGLLSRFNQTVCNAAFPILNRNYRFNSKKYEFFVVSSLCKKSMYRKGDIFSITFETPIFWLRDGVSIIKGGGSLDLDSEEGISVHPSFLALDGNGRLVEFEMPDREKAQYPICTVKITAEYDLSAVNEEGSNISAKFEMLVSTDRPEFKYFGPRQGAEIKCLSNVSDELYYDFSRAPRFGKQISKFFAKTEIEIEDIFQKIISSNAVITVNDGSTYILKIRKMDMAKKTLFEAIMSLFELALNRRILQELVDKFIKQIVNDYIQMKGFDGLNEVHEAMSPRGRLDTMFLEVFNDNARHICKEDLKLKFYEHLVTYLEKNESGQGDDLIARATDELIDILKDLGLGKLFEIYLILNVNYISDLKYSALFLKSSPEVYRTEEGLAVDDKMEEWIVGYSDTISKMISAVQFAIQETLRKRGFAVVLGRNQNNPNNLPEAQDEIKSFDEVNQIFLDYLRECLKKAQQQLHSKHTNKELLDPIYTFTATLQNKDSVLSPSRIPDIDPLLFIKVGKNIKKHRNTGSYLVLDMPGVPQGREIAHYNLSRRVEYRSRFKTWQKFSVLLERNPFFKGINEGLAIHYLVDQFLSTNPNYRIRAQPYLAIADLIGALLGGAIGTYAILNPSKPLNKNILKWEALTKSLGLFVFTMFDIILIYRNFMNDDKDCPSRNQCNIDDEDFYLKMILPATAFVSINLIYDLAYGIKLRLTEREASSLSYRILRPLSNWLYDVNIFQIFQLKVLNFDKEDGEIYTFIPSVLLATGFGLMGIGPWHNKTRNFLSVTRSFVSCVTFMAIWISQYIHQLNHDVPMNETIEVLRFTLWGLLLMYTIGFIRQNYGEFIRHYKDDYLSILQTSPEPPGLEAVGVQSPYHRLEGSEEESRRPRTPIDLSTLHSSGQSQDLSRSDGALVLASEPLNRSQQESSPRVMAHQYAALVARRDDNEYKYNGERTEHKHAKARGSQTP